MTPKQISQSLANRAEEVAKMLLPNGKKHGKEWAVGSATGEAGKSTKVCISGDKAGVWSDFAEGASGDLLDLWAEAKGVSLFEAIQEAKLFLGIQDPKWDKPKKKFNKPETPKCSRPDGKELEWLTETRKLSLAAIEAYQVAARPGQVIFPFKRGPEKGAEMPMMKWRSTTEKKTMPTSAGQQPSLFGWQAIPKNAREVTIVEGECFPGSAEVLTRSGWVRLDQYTHGQVAQYSDGEISWAHPLAKVEKEFQGDLLRYETRGFVSETTPGHGLISLDLKGRHYKHTAAEGPRAAGHFIPRVGKLEGSGIPLTDSEIRLCIAISADAGIDERLQSYAGGPARHVAAERRYAKFGLKKARKVERLRWLLAECAITASDTTIKNGYQSICFSIPEWIPGRFLPWDWIAQASGRQREIILSELIEWDGNLVAGRDQSEYSTKYEKNADWVQALAHTAGRVSTIIRRKNDFGSWLKVSILNAKKTTSWQSLRGKSVPVPHSGKVFCVQVPSGAILVRQEGKVTVSGNCDAMALWDYGIPALSVPFGGGKGEKQAWIEYEYQALEQFDTIYVCMDADGPGREGAKEIIERLGRERCRLVNLPAKDANDCLLQGVPAEMVQKAFRQSVYMDPSELKSAGDYYDEIIWQLYPEEAPQDSTSLLPPWPHTHDNIQFRMSELMVMGGVNGHGKTQFVGYLTLNACRQNAKACIASMEMPPGRLLGNMTRQATGQRQPTKGYIRAVNEWYRDKIWMFDCIGTAKTEKILEIFEYARKRYGVTWFVIDSLMKCGIDEDDYNAQKRFLERLADFKNEHNVFVCLLVHLRKGESEFKPSGKMDVKGTGAITDLADTVGIIWRNKPKEEVMTSHESGSKTLTDEDYDIWHNTPDSIWNIVKQRNSPDGWEGKINLYFDLDGLQYHAGPEAKPFQYVNYSGPVEEVA